MVVSAPGDHGQCRSGIIMKYEWLINWMKAEYQLQSKGRDEKRAVHAEAIRRVGQVITVEVDANQWKTRGGADAVEKRGHSVEPV